MDVPNSSYIIELETEIESESESKSKSANKNKYSKITISNYKKQDVMKAFSNCVIDESKIEESTRWMVELHVSGFVDKIVDKFVNIYSQHINIHNPTFPSFIIKKIKQLEDAKKMHELDLIQTRNNQEVRNILIDILITISTSKKDKITEHRFKPSDFETSLIGKNVRSKDMKMVEKLVSKRGDSTEVKIALNEIANYLNCAKNIENIDMTNIYYWIGWLHHLENEHKKKIKTAKNKTNGKHHKNKNKTEFCYDVYNLGGDSSDYGDNSNTNSNSKYCKQLQVKKRKIAGVSEKYRADWAWILWKIIISEAYSRDNSILEEEILALFELYKRNYNLSSKKQKKYLIYTAIHFLIKKVLWDTPLYSSYPTRIRACCNINYMYSRLQKYMKNQHQDFEKEEETNINSEKEEEETNINLEESEKEYIYSEKEDINNIHNNNIV